MTTPANPTPAALRETRRFRWIDDEFAPNGRRRVAVHVNPATGEEGFYARWTMSCSGCFEVGDYMQGQENYPWDERAKCRIGAGCEECGYTGKRRVIYFVPFTAVEARHATT